MKGMLAVRTGHLAGNTFKVKLSVLRNRAFGQHAPVELNRVIHNRGKFTDHQINTCDLFCSSLIGMAQRNIENTTYFIYKSLENTKKTCNFA